LTPAATGQAERKLVAVIGGGASGTLTAIALPMRTAADVAATRLCLLLGASRLGMALASAAVAVTSQTSSVSPALNQPIGEVGVPG
jgi:hypothetical protein